MEENNNPQAFVNTNGKAGFNLGRFFNRKTFGLFIILILVAAIPLIVIVSQKSQDIRQRASEETHLLNASMRTTKTLNSDNERGTEEVQNFDNPNPGKYILNGEVSVEDSGLATLQIGVISNSAFIPYIYQKNRDRDIHGSLPITVYIHSGENLRVERSVVHGSATFSNMSLTYNPENGLNPTPPFQFISGKLTTLAKGPAKDIKVWIFSNSDKREVFTNEGGSFGGHVPRGNNYAVRIPTQSNLIRSRIDNGDTNGWGNSWEQQISGEGCQANCNFIVDLPKPTGVISGPSSGNINTDLIYSTAAQGLNLDKIAVYSAPILSNLMQRSSWTKIGEKDCQGNPSCTTTVTFKSQRSGDYYIAVNAYDKNALWCSGSPAVKDGRIKLDGLGLCDSESRDLITVNIRSFSISGRVYIDNARNSYTSSLSVSSNEGGTITYTTSSGTFIIADLPTRPSNGSYYQISMPIPSGYKVTSSNLAGWSCGGTQNPAGGCSGTLYGSVLLSTLQNSNHAQVTITLASLPTATTIPTATSIPATNTPPTPTPTPLAAPTGVNSTCTITVSDGTILNVSWFTVTGASKYRINLRDVNEADMNPNGIDNGNVTSYRTGNVLPNHTYTGFITAVDAAGNRGNQAHFTATCPPAPTATATSVPPTATSVPATATPINTPTPTTGTYHLADFNHSGCVNNSDFNLWKDAYTHGQTPQSGVYYPNNRADLFAYVVWYNAMKNTSVNHCSE